MFIRFNYRCPVCGHEEERFIKKDKMDDQVCGKNWAMFSTDDFHCPATMTRLPAAPRTTFMFADRKLKR